MGEPVEMPEPGHVFYPISGHDWGGMKIVSAEMYGTEMGEEPTHIFLTFDDRSGIAVHRHEIVRRKGRMNEWTKKPMK